MSVSHQRIIPLGFLFLLSYLVEKNSDTRHCLAMVIRCCHRAVKCLTDLIQPYHLMDVI